jgi:hypothetical protein
MWGHGLDRSGSEYGQAEALVSAVMNIRVPENAENRMAYKE